MSVESRTVVVCGDSIVMSSIGASCRRAGLDVVPLDTYQADPAGQLRRLSPDVLLYDFAHPPADFIVRSLAQDPRRLLIGINLDRDCMLVLSGQHERAVTTTDLVRVIATWRDSTRRLPLWQAHLDRLGQFISRRLASLRAYPRRQKPVFAFAALAVCAVLALLLLPTGLQSNAPLTGTAVGGLAPELALAFAAGILFGGLLFALALGWGHHRSQSKIHYDKMEEQE